MPTLFGDHDRGRASNHAIFIWRDLHVPARKIVAVLPRISDRLAGKLSLMVPTPATTTASLPIELLIAPCHEASEWRIELRLSSRGTIWDFFDGEVRLERRSATTTHLVLVGRFTLPREELREHVDETALHDIAEDNLIRIFETILLEIESAVAAGAKKARLNAGGGDPRSL
jgi:hypothetical protein